MISRAQRHRRGIRAEQLAALFLQLKGYRILARRFKTPVGEIDVIAQRGKTLAIVEVKHRRHVTTAAESIHTSNQQRVVQAAQYYLATHEQAVICTIRFDAILIPWYGIPIHLRNAFDASFLY